MSDNMIAEYTKLCNEIDRLDSDNTNLTIAMYTISITVIGFAIQFLNPCLLLCVYLVLLPFQATMNYKENCIARDGAYIKVFYEAHNLDLQWEKYLTKFNNKLNVRNISFYLSRFGSLYIAILCVFISCGLLVYHSDFFTLTGILYMIVSILFSFATFLLCFRIVRSRSIEVSYKTTFEELENNVDN